MNTTFDFVAAYGAVVATLALGWRIYEWLANRPRIRLKVLFLHMYDMPGVNPDTRFISVSAMNKGHRSTTMSAAGFRTSFKGRGSDLVCVPNEITGRLPHRLNEGESCDVIFDEAKLIEAISKLGPGIVIKFAWYKDQADRLYKVKLPRNVKNALMISTAG
ncbi:hypothetical protein ACFLYE_01165 [Chloroflexota bacterium]